MSSRLDALIAELSAHTPVQVEDADRRQAGVALILAKNPDRLLLIKRADHPGDPWSGQLALPGGRREPADTDLLDTAIRETFEETGIQLARQSCLATLGDLAPSSAVLPPILVRPFVFIVETPVTITLSREVATASWVEFADLAREGTYRTEEVAALKRSLSAKGYRVSEGFLWGMTERMLTPIINIWRGLEAKS